MNKSAFVWFISGGLLALYGISVLAAIRVPGVEELVIFLQNIPPKYIFVAAFLAIFFEGLYVIGNFFPGATLVIIITVLAQESSWITFLLSIIAIFSGWTLAGLINIVGASYFKRIETTEKPIVDKVWTTWFPSFRSAYEVTQVIEGNSPIKVALSGLKVRFFACIGAALYCIGVALLVDINKLSNEEGAWSVFIIALIMLIVGYVKMNETPTPTQGN